MADQHEDEGAQDSTRWPSVPRDLAPQTPDLYAGTSLEPPPLPPRPAYAINAGRRQLQEIRDLQEEIGEAYEAWQQQRAERARREEAMRQARGAADGIALRLHDHYQTAGSLEATLTQELAAFRRSDLEIYNELQQHMRNALDATPSDVRTYDISSWFRKEVPKGLRDALDALRSYHMTEAELRIKLRQVETSTSTWGVPSTLVHSHDDYAMRRHRRSKGEERFGWDAEGDSDFEQYSAESDGEPDYKHLHANFEVRKLRILHAEADLRYPAAGDWEHSLDYSVVTFISSGCMHLIENEPQAKDVYFDDQLQNTLESLSKAAAANNNQPFQKVVDSMKDFHKILVERHKTITKVLSEQKMLQQERHWYDQQLRSATTQEQKDSLRELKQNVVRQSNELTAKLEEAERETMPLGTDVEG